MSPSEPRIAYICKVYPRFSETFIVSEVRAREAAGDRIDIVSLRTPTEGRFHASLAEVRAPVHYLPSGTPRPQDLWEALGTVPAGHALDELRKLSVRDAAQALELASLVRSAGFDHLHAHFGSVATTVARVASLLTGVPYSFTAHAKDLFHEDVDPVELRTKLADAHHVVTVSDHNVRWLQDRFGDAAARVRRVYNGLDLDAFAFSPEHTAPDGPADVGPEDRRRDVVAVGRLVEKKGFDVLVRAAAVARDRGTPVTVRIVGSGQCEAQLRCLIEEHELGDQVQLLGPLPQDQVREEVRRAAVMAAPCVVGADGNADGLPTVVLEAMALGTPVVATPVTGMPEAVLHDRTGVLVPERDAEQLAAELLQLCADGDRRRRLAVAARRHVEERFDSHRQAQELRQLLDEVAVDDAAVA